MAFTTISDLWTPAVWIPGLAERSTVRPSLINSGIAARNPEIESAASGGGTQANIPFLKTPNFDDEIQAQNTDITINAIGSGLQVAPILNRGSGLGSEALAGAVSATDPVGFVLDSIADLRLRQRQKTLLNILRGVFGFAAAPGAGSAAFKAMRSDIFIEAGATATAANLFSSDAFIDVAGLFGELGDLLERGAVVAHSKVVSAMKKQDDVTTIRDSEGKIVMHTYKGLPLFVSDLLVRAGGTSGFVYDTYLILPAAVATGEKPQVNQVGQTASLLMHENAIKNQVAVLDRNRFILHPQGAKWQGTPAGNSATNAELATEGNWALAFGDVKNVGIACLRTNG